MKKILLSLMFFSAVLAANSQDIEKSAALKLISGNKNAIGLTSEDLNNSIVSNAYFNATAGTQMIYLQQTYKGIPVLNQIQSLAFKNGILVSAAGYRIKGIEKLTKMAGISTAISAETAVRSAMASKKITSNQPLIYSTANTGRKLDFGKGDICNENITAELLWVPVNDGKSVKLAWQVYLVPSATSDYWLISIDANNNEIINEINLTVYCNFDGDKNHQHQSNCNSNSDNLTGFFNLNSNKSVNFSPSIVNGASYRVVPFPAEAPLHTGGTPAIVTNPWTLALGNATSLKWHSNGTTDWTYTRGNNVWAYHDRTNANAGDPTRSAQSTTTPDPLTFDFVPDFTVAPTQTTPVQNQQFNITNLFYWNNIIHDLVYQYGFDEVSGNFQSNNQGRGGAGNDHVKAEAQDGSGTNNANFSTPADGGSGVMQMYLWNGSPQKDGDVDNGVIVHEFAHGISNRLAGGPAQAGCVSNAEQMGEGWSDYYALMATQDWANSLLTDGFNKPRGIGTYAIGQTPSGLGIRSQRYCTNFAINNKVYATTIPGAGAQHSRGELWCATLWDMTWNIINQVGSINPNIFNGTSSGGNSIALKLVTEGLKLQVCNSGFIDGRNGILQADQILYGGAYRCAIMQAFARRGMGFDAVQGSANSTTDQIPGFSTVESILSLTQNVTQQLEGLNITYNNSVSAGTCSGLSNYLLTDTLPSNVTYVSGGTYTAATRVVSFPVNLAAGQTQNYAFTVQVNNGSWFPPANLIDEKVLTTSIPSIWTTSSVNTTNFTVSSAQSQSAPNAFFGVNATGISDFSIATNTAIALGAAPPTLTFWHNYNTEDGWDGGVVEISPNGGATWSDLGANMTQNGYNGSMGTGSNNPLGGRSAFTGNSNGFIKTTISLLPYANQNALFRFRMGSDDNTAVTGWYIDDILLQSKAVVNMRSSLFNASGVRVNIKDTVTTIIQNAGCTQATITTQPVNTNVCAASNTSFSVVATGTTVVYQWQVSSDGGITYSNITGATGSTLNLTAVTIGMNNNRYRVVVSNACPSSATSIGAVLTVSDAATVTTQPVNTSVCLNGNASFSVAASGSALTYQWQVSTNGGTSFSNIAAATGSTLNIAGVTAAMNNNQYRAVVFSCGPTGTNSNAATLGITSPASVTTAPASVTICPGDNTSFSVVVNGSNLSYQWQLSNNGGAFTNLSNSSIYSGVTASTLTVTGIAAVMNGYAYRVLVSGPPCGTVVSNTASLVANLLPAVVLVASEYNRITPAVPATLYTTVSPAGNYTYQWFKNNFILSGIAGSSYPVDVDRLGNYTVTITDVNGCRVSSNIVTVSDSVSNQLFIYSNPNNGQFQVRYFSPNNSTEERTLIVYDAKGAKIYSKKYAISRTYDRMDVSLTNAQSGVYTVDLRDSKGKRIASGSVIIQ